MGLISDIEQQSAQLASEDNDFLIRMGLTRTLLTEIMYSQRAVPEGQNGRIPLISWGGADVDEIVAGKYDAAIDAAAVRLQALGAPFYLRWFWEPDGTRASSPDPAWSSAVWSSCAATLTFAGIGLTEPVLEPPQ